VSALSRGYAQEKPDSTLLDSGTPVRRSAWLTVRSNPEGAEVYDDSTFLGVTPLDSVVTTSGIHVLRSFYPSARFWDCVSACDTVNVASFQTQSCIVQFGGAPTNGMFRYEAQESEQSPILFVVPSNTDRTKSWMGYAAGSTMIISGALSAYFKTSSDNTFDSYVVNRDPTLLSKVRRLDAWAGVSLIITEVSFGVLTYLLLSE